MKLEGILNATLDADLRVVLTEDIPAWCLWFESSWPGRQVARDNIGGFVISTVFLGCIVHYGSGEPRWFETMVFREDAGGEMKPGEDRFKVQYPDWELAALGHKVVCEMVMKGEIGE